MAERTPNHQELALRAVDRIRRSRGFAELGTDEQRKLDRDLSRIAGALEDPYDRALETPMDLQRRLARRGREPQTRQAPPAAPARPPAPPRKDATQTIGERADAALEAIDFPGFVAGLVTGTFQAIVDATAQQVREYAQLVASISQSVDDFSRDNVTPFQVKEWLTEQHPDDLRIEMPPPGSGRAARLVPVKGREDSQPAWLSEFGLAGQDLTTELTDGALVSRARSRLGEERLQSLATMVLMGIQRVVVNEGHIRAKLQFHASARDRRKAEIRNASVGKRAGIAGQQVRMATAAQTQVSTLKANVQADSSLRADLMGEVHIVFGTETFSLNNFADGQAIQLISRHAKWKGEPREAAPAQPAAPAETAPVSPPASPPAEGAT